MALPASGQLALSQVNTELGLNSTATIGMGDSLPRGLAKISSGQIAMSDFYGKASMLTVQMTINPNGSKVWTPQDTYWTSGNLNKIGNIFEYAYRYAGWDMNQRLKIIFGDPNKPLSFPDQPLFTSQFIDYYAFTLTQWYNAATNTYFTNPNGVEIWNYGYILGRGGNGGYPGAGQNGGPGITYRLPGETIIYNYGVIGGGGGGGGAGLPTDNTSSGGGAGGAPYGDAYLYLSNGSVNSGTGKGAYYTGFVDAGVMTGGVSGKTLSPPYGGYGVDRWGYPGGDGGAPGQSGSVGSPNPPICVTLYNNTTCNGGRAGGQPGIAITEFKNYPDYPSTSGPGITWGRRGTILGAEVVAT